MLNPLAVLPLHLACQLLITENLSDNNLTSVVDNSLKWPKLAAELPHGYTVFPDIGVAYKRYDKSITWHDARKYCAGEGSNLAVLNSFLKVSYADGLRKKDNSAMHVGIHRIFDGTEWVDIVNGLPVTMIPWKYPSYSENKERKCMAIEGSDTGLSAIPCEWILPFLCEIKIQSNDQEPALLNIFQG